MALGSVLQTALSGMAAAETLVAVIANNLANARTPGYKAASPLFTTQQPQTQSRGAAPDGSGGGGDPVQVGVGVMVAGMSADLSQGPIAIIDPQNGGAGKLVPGGIELSNTDIAESLVDLKSATNLFRANLQVADTAGHLLDELIHLRRAPR